jgi:hypothetical protein
LEIDLQFLSRHGWCFRWFMTEAIWSETSQHLGDFLLRIWNPSGGKVLFNGLLDELWGEWRRH